MRHKELGQVENLSEGKEEFVKAGQVDNLSSFRV